MTVVAVVYPGAAADKLVEHEVEGVSYNPAGAVKGFAHGPVT
jgi:hypothetical protein